MASPGDTVQRGPARASPPGDHPERKPRRRRFRYIVVGVIALCLAVLLAFVVVGFDVQPRSSGGLSPTQSMVLYPVQGHSFGPGLVGNVTVQFEVPTASSTAFITGNLTVTGCTSPGNYCLANVAIFTPANWANYQHDRPSIVVLCFNPGAGTCQSAQKTFINGTDELSPFDGGLLDLCFWSNATVGAQTFTADATLHYTTIPPPHT